MSKKVLIITYYWPPSGGPGVQRVLKFCKYLPKYGWEPIVLTVENGEYPAIDSSLVSEIPSDLKVSKLKTFEPFGLYKVMRGQKTNKPISAFELLEENKTMFQRCSHRIRNNLFFPDARVGFYLRNKFKLKKFIETYKPEMIITSGPPHSLHLFGLRIKTKFGLNWIADFRDPWVDAFWEQSNERNNFIKKKLLNLEKSILQKSDQITVVSEGLKNIFSTKINALKIHTIYNGFDSSDFENIRKSNSNTFRMTFLGGLGANQISEFFFLALTELNKTFPIIVKFIGKIHQGVYDLVEKYKLHDIVKILEYKPHKEALFEIVNSDLLLLFIAKNAENGVLSGKLFEYLATKNRILAIIGRENSDLESILLDCNAGGTLNYKDSFLPFLKLELEKWKSGKQVKVNSNMINLYTRKRQTQKLAQLLDKYYKMNDK